MKLKEDLLLTVLNIKKSFQNYQKFIIKKTINNTLNQVQKNILI